MDIKKTILYALNILFPKTCLGCGRDIKYDSVSPFCRKCSADIKTVSAMYCKKCGNPEEPGLICGDCRGLKYLDGLRSAFIFADPIRKAVHAFKYGDRPELASFLGGEMAEIFREYDLFSDSFFLLPVPLHKKKLKERGYNQSSLLASVIAEKNKLFIIENAAERNRKTESQARLDRKGRIKNMAEAFTVTSVPQVKNRNIIIVDDVATTLATLDSLAGALKKAGAKKVTGFTLAREPAKPVLR